jgi:hypothetical protein
VVVFAIDGDTDAVHQQGARDGNREVTRQRDGKANREVTRQRDGKAEIRQRDGVLARRCQKSLT